MGVNGFCPLIGLLIPYLEGLEHLCFLFGPFFPGSWPWVLQKALAELQDTFDGISPI